MNRIVTLGFIFLLGAGGCELLSERDAHLIPGEVVISVKEEVTVTYLEWYTRLKGVLLKAHYFPSTYIAMVSVPGGNATDYVEALQADSLVAAVYPEGNERLTLVMQVAADEIYLRQVLTRQEGLALQGVIKFQKLAVIGVPIGQEGRWVRRLQREAFVITAERNQRVVLKGQPL